jgi:hypothetical protein
MKNLKEALSLVDSHITKLVQEKLGDTPILRTKTDQGETFVITREQLKFLVRKTVNHIQEKCRPGHDVEEQQVKIKVKKPGVLDVPEGKNVDDLPYSHFLSVAKRKGFVAVIRALNNLNVWNRKKNPTLSNWADKMQDRISKAKEASEKK